MAVGRSFSATDHARSQTHVSQIPPVPRSPNPHARNDGTSTAARGRFKFKINTPLLAQSILPSRELRTEPLLRHTILGDGLDPIPNSRFGATGLCPSEKKRFIR